MMMLVTVLCLLMYADSPLYDDDDETLYDDDDDGTLYDAVSRRFSV